MSLEGKADLCFSGQENLFDCISAYDGTWIDQIWLVEINLELFFFFNLMRKKKNMEENHHISNS